MVNYASVFNQSETGKYFEWIIRTIIPCSLNMVTVPVCSKLKTSWKSAVFRNKVGKNSRYFVGVFNKKIIALALLGNEMIIANSYPTRTRGIIVKYHSQSDSIIANHSYFKVLLAFPLWKYDDFTLPNCVRQNYGVKGAVWVLLWGKWCWFGNEIN